MIEQCLMVDFELFSRCLQAFDAFIQLGEEFFDFGYYAVCSSVGGRGISVELNQGAGTRR